MLKSAALPASVVLAYAALTAAQLTINTPQSPVVCQPLAIAWSGGTPPYFVSLHPGDTPNDPAILDFGKQDGTSLTWLVNQQANTNLDLTIRDNTGTTQQSAPFRVQSGSDTSCLSAPASFSPSASGSGASETGSSTGTSTSAAGGTSTTAPPPTGTSTTGGSTGTTSGTSAGSNTSKGTSSTSAKPSQSSNAAGAQMTQIGVAGFVGAAIMAALV